MGRDIRGQIHFGVSFEEYFEFPWDDEKYDGGIESWWMDINGYIPLYQPFTPEGDYAEGWKGNDPRFGEYYNHKRNWLVENPVPVALESSGTGDYLIVVPKKGLSTSWDPLRFNPEELTVTDEEVAVLKDFLAKYGIEYDNEPAWLLSGYYS